MLKKKERKERKEAGIVLYRWHLIQHSQWKWIILTKLSTAVFKGKINCQAANRLKEDD